MDNYTADQISKWPDIGQTENEEYGVNSVHAKKTKTGYTYACLFWRYGTPSIEWVLKDGKLIKGGQ